MLHFLSLLGCAHKDDDAWMAASLTVLSAIAAGKPTTTQKIYTCLDFSAFEGYEEGGLIIGDKDGDRLRVPCPESYEVISTPEHTKSAFLGALSSASKSLKGDDDLLIVVYAHGDGTGDMIVGEASHCTIITKQEVAHALKAATCRNCYVWLNTGYGGKWIDESMPWLAYSIAAGHGSFAGSHSGKFRGLSTYMSILDLMDEISWSCPLYVPSDQSESDIATSRTHSMSANIVSGYHSLLSSTYPRTSTEQHSQRDLPIPRISQAVLDRFTLVPRMISSSTSIPRRPISNRAITFVSNLEKIRSTSAWPGEVNYDQLLDMGIPMLDADISAASAHRERSLFHHVLSENACAEDIRALWAALSHRQDALNRVYAFIEHGPWAVKSDIQTITWDDIHQFYSANHLSVPELSTALGCKWSRLVVWDAPKHALMLHWVRAGRPPFSCALFLDSLSKIECDKKNIILLEHQQRMLKHQENSPVLLVMTKETPESF